MRVSWSDFKANVADQGFKVRYVKTGDVYRLNAFDPGGIKCMECKLQVGSAECDDFETNFKNLWSVPHTSDVTTRMEKDDKTLTTVYAFGVTDATGRAEAKFPIPTAGRYLAYGDAEFETRHFFDRIVSICVRDDDRLIAMGVALQMNPEATEPADDATTAAATGIADYPVLGDYCDKAVPTGDFIFSGGPPGYGPGMVLTFKYGTTEVSPVGGYAFVDGTFWFVVVAQKGERCPPGELEGIGFSISVDGAQLDA